MAGVYDDQILGAKQQAETLQRIRDEALGMSAPQGRMVGNYYIAPHWTQNLAHMLRNISAQNQAEDANTKAEELTRQKNIATIQAMNSAGMQAPDAMVQAAMTPKKDPSVLGRVASFLRGEEPQDIQPIQQNVAKVTTPEQRDQAFMHLLAVNPEVGKAMIDYQKSQSEMDSKAMRRARLGAPTGFDINENGELVPMSVAGGGDYLTSVLPAQAAARGSYISPIQQGNFDISKAHLDLAQQNAQIAQQKEQRQESLKQWEMENPNAQKNLNQIEEARSANQKLQDTLDSYKEKLSNMSALDIANPMSNADLQSAHQAATWPIRSETMMNTGVLNPGEMGMLNKALTDPTSLRGLSIGKDQIIKQIDEIKRISAENANAIIKSRKPAPPPGMEDSAYWKKLNGAQNGNQPKDQQKQSGFKLLGVE